MGTWLIVSSSFITAFSTDKNKKGEKESEKRKNVMHMEVDFLFSVRSAPEPFRFARSAFSLHPKESGLR